MSCAAESFSARMGSSPPLVIVDLDAGSDDAWALLMLLRAEECGHIKILALTCVQGNTSVHNVCTNVLRILDSVDRLDIPVYRGAEQPLIPTAAAHVPPHLSQYHGADGFGDVSFPTSPDHARVLEESAVSALHRITSRTPGVSLVCLGPLTNIALAMRTHPQLADNINHIYAMGGNSTGRGNVTSSAEFNFYNDPEAAHILLSSAKCPVVLLPWETCLQYPLSLEWRFNVLGAKSTRQVSLMNQVERSVFARLGCDAMLSCDQLLTAALLRPDMVTDCSMVHMSVELHGRHTRGQAVIDHLENNQPNVLVIHKVKLDVFKEMMLFAAGHHNQLVGCTST